MPKLEGGFNMSTGIPGRLHEICPPENYTKYNKLCDNYDANIKEINNLDNEGLDYKITTLIRGNILSIPREYNSGFAKFSDKISKFLTNESQAGPKGVLTVTAGVVLAVAIGTGLIASGAGAVGIGILIGLIAVTTLIGLFQGFIGFLSVNSTEMITRADHNKLEETLGNLDVGQKKQLLVNHENSTHLSNARAIFSNKEEPAAITTHQQPTLLSSRTRSELAISAANARAELRARAVDRSENGW